jgi:Protease inhibitor Inh
LLRTGRAKTVEWPSFSAIARLRLVEGREHFVYMRTRISHIGVVSGMGKAVAGGPRFGVLAAGLVAALLLSACSSLGTSATADNAEQLAPVQNGNVSTSALPPIGPNGEVQGATQPAAGDTQPGVTGGIQTANAGAVPAGPGAMPNSSGRDLSGGLTVEKLLGRWTVVSGQDQCALNLTQTQKTGTGRYRASAPACGLKGLVAVASWALAGTQVQLFDDGGNIIGALILSGNRFIGTLSGGQGISMVG